MKWLKQCLQWKCLIGRGAGLNKPLVGSIQLFLYDVIKITMFCDFPDLSYQQNPELLPAGYAARESTMAVSIHGIGATLWRLSSARSRLFVSCFVHSTVHRASHSAVCRSRYVLMFLISSPMVDLGSLCYLLMSIFGVKVAVIYVIVGLMIAVIGGSLD
jgi:hypothetical protein